MADEVVGYIPRGGRDYRERFWSKVEPASGCWNWVGPSKGGGYGQFSYQVGWGRTRQVTAHRFAWEMAYGPIPDGLLVCHACDNRKCVRLTHLWLGTDLDNARDKMDKGRDNLASRKWSSQPRTGVKISFDDAEAIRFRASRGESKQVLASEYGVSHSLVSLIVHGKRWVRNG
jgi:hypothetical protein